MNGSIFVGLDVHKATISVAVAEGRRGGDKRIEELAPQWSMTPFVEAVQAMRGVAFIVAVTVVAEVGDFSRCGFHGS